jgi:hypothetical protein
LKADSIEERNGSLHSDNSLLKGLVLDSDLAEFFFTWMRPDVAKIPGGIKRRGEEWAEGRGRGEGEGGGRRKGGRGRKEGGGEEVKEGQKEGGGGGEEVEEGRKEGREEGGGE